MKITITRIAMIFIIKTKNFKTKIILKAWDTFRYFKVEREIPF